MKLIDYMVAKNISDDAFASLAGCSRTQINRVKRGACFPKPKLMARIVAMTDGAVQPNDFFDSEAA